MTVNVNTYSEFLTRLNVHLLQTVFTENPEAALTWVLVVCLNNKFL